MPNPFAHWPLLANISRASRLTGLSPDTIRECLRLGQLTSVEVGSRRLIPKAELLRLTGVRVRDDD
jgi:excisionase family DNA binding protein